jgi:hypothetical protein
MTPRLGRALLALALAGAAAAAPGARADVRRPGDPPPLCQGNLFADQIGTPGQDLLRAGNRAERLWGMDGDDLLLGSDRRASCLFGGRGADELALGAGGGLAVGEPGDDLLLGGPLDDVLLGGDGDDTIAGGPGDDVIDGNGGVDAIDAGPGDDHVTAVDGRAEFVDCGPGTDDARTDRSDVVIGCEHLVRVGTALPRLAPSPTAASAAAIVRVHFRVHRRAPGGAYRIVMITGAQGRACAGGPLELTRLRRVHRGQFVRVGLRPPAGGWCPGPIKAVLARYDPCRAGSACLSAPPARPLARIEFTAARKGV